ncbi:hypothetical protein BC829DRAFT_494742 [Chytridium lagenaria]|nr:hypothetical protein BC829DRAFT_494742 [Chytridium lagenaria]
MPSCPPAPSATVPSAWIVPFVLCTNCNSIAGPRDVGYQIIAAVFVPSPMALTQRFELDLDCPFDVLLHLCSPGLHPDPPTSAPAPRAASYASVAALPPPDRSSPAAIAARFNEARRSRIARTAATPPPASPPLMIFELRRDLRALAPSIPIPDLFYINSSIVGLTVHKDQKDKLLTSLDAAKFGTFDPTFDPSVPVSLPRLPCATTSSTLPCLLWRDSPCHPPSSCSLPCCVPAPTFDPFYDPNCPPSVNLPPSTTKDVTPTPSSPPLPLRPRLLFVVPINAIPILISPLLLSASTPPAMTLSIGYQNAHGLRFAGWQHLTGLLRSGTFDVFVVAETWWLDWSAIASSPLVVGHSIRPPRLPGVRGHEHDGLLLAYFPPRLGYHPHPTPGGRCPSVLCPLAILGDFNVTFSMSSAGSLTGSPVPRRTSLITYFHSYFPRHPLTFLPPHPSSPAIPHLDHLWACASAPSLGSSDRPLIRWPFLFLTMKLRDPATALHLAHHFDAAASPLFSQLSLLRTLHTSSRAVQQAALDSVYATLHDTLHYSCEHVLGSYDPGTIQLTPDRLPDALATSTPLPTTSVSSDAINDPAAPPLVLPPAPPPRPRWKIAMPTMLTFCSSPHRSRPAPPLPPPQSLDFVAAFTNSSISSSILQYPTHKACGHDSLHVLVLRALIPSPSFFPSCLPFPPLRCLRPHPTAWNHATLTLLPKTEPPTAPNTRPIALTLMLRRLFERIFLSFLQRANFPGWLSTPTKLVFAMDSAASRMPCSRMPSLVPEKRPSPSFWISSLLTIPWTTPGFSKCSTPAAAPHLHLPHLRPHASAVVGLPQLAPPLLLAGSSPSPSFLSLPWSAPPFLWVDWERHASGDPDAGCLASGSLWHPSARLTILRTFWRPLLDYGLVCLALFARLQASAGFAALSDLYASAAHSLLTSFTYHLDRLHPLHPLRAWFFSVVPPGLFGLGFAFDVCPLCVRTLRLAFDSLPSLVLVFLPFFVLTLSP